VRQDQRKRIMTITRQAILKRRADRRTQL